MNDNNEVLSIRKIPYEMIIEISIESKKFIEIPINRLSESEVLKLK
jgi:hypothetical protein